MLYKYSPETIANMTPEQQYDMLDLSDSDRKDTVHFNTTEELNAWLSTR